ncbi:hypothetical protein [Confluentibacter flavum]|uniref:Uncharacterized protein n=1 Tax=Confluentibacter flavum TaxID=1909700 RepID=A0A2N3HL37_9FLAO|nr:hypothetical protein [Confluentibacter flavum]PKQ45651.1 hypothetical protein CSW08_06175 [Confluentibacter flavum]
MKKTLQFLSVAIILLLSINVKADTIINSELNLFNPDVRKCLLEASKSEGWELKSIYMNSEEKLVYVFSKGNDDKVYLSK